MVEVYKSSMFQSSLLCESTHLTQNTVSQTMYNNLEGGGINSLTENERYQSSLPRSEKKTSSPPLDDLNLVVPFPPKINVQDLVNNLLQSKSQKPRIPNEFFIYRTAYVKELKARGYAIKMVKASKLASSSWRNETNRIKSEYRKLARETENLFIQARAKKARMEDIQKGAYKSMGTTLSSSTLTNSHSPELTPTSVIAIQAGSPFQQWTYQNPSISSSRSHPGYPYESQFSPMISPQSSNSAVQFHNVNIYNNYSETTMENEFVVPSQHIIPSQNSPRYSFSQIERNYSQSKNYLLNLQPSDPSNFDKGGASSSAEVAEFNFLQYND